jgi:hypothetical protein
MGCTPTEAAAPAAVAAATAVACAREQKKKNNCISVRPNVGGGCARVEIPVCANYTVVVGPRTSKRYPAKYPIPSLYHTYATDHYAAMLPRHLTQRSEAGFEKTI